MERFECVVVGAGVIGLALARALTRDGREVLLLDEAKTFGTQTSSRNSEVIHAGIYYTPGSLMARFCVEGRKALYEYCESRNIPHRRCGKLIVATSTEEVGRLEAIESNAKSNGVEDLSYLTEKEAQRLEPALTCKAALLSPTTGIIDSHAYMLSLLADAEAAGAIFAPRTRFLEAAASDFGFKIVAEMEGDEPLRLQSILLINAAGLGAPQVAKAIAGLDARHVPTPYYAKGNYFSLAGTAPFSRLIYPVPVPGGLGVHLTLDLAGRARFGPDVEWIDDVNYAVDPTRANGFEELIRRYWPGLPQGRLAPDYAGIRPKIVPPSVAKQDFVISGPTAHGVGGLVNLFGIESPGLTASLAIADFVACMVRQG